LNLYQNCEVDGDVLVVPVVVRPVVLNVGAKTDKKLSNNFLGKVILLNNKKLFLEIILNTLLFDQQKLSKQENL
jgi:hypothetical protein